MAKELKPGDEVVCRIKESAIVSAYSSYDEEKVFEIIAFDSKGYYLYVPEYYSLKETAVITEHVAKSLEINKKFINGSTIYVTASFIYRVHKLLDGCTCIKCNEFHEYSVSNQEDKTFICWRCRSYPFYR